MALNGVSAHPRGFSSSGCILNLSGWTHMTALDALPHSLWPRTQAETRDAVRGALRPRTTHPCVQRFASLTLIRSLLEGKKPEEPLQNFPHSSRGKCRQSHKAQPTGLGPVKHRLQQPRRAASGVRSWGTRAPTPRLSVFQETPSAHVRAPRSSSSSSRVSDASQRGTGATQRTCGVFRARHGQSAQV